MSPFFCFILGLQLTLGLKKTSQLEEAALLQFMGLKKVPSPRIVQPVPFILRKIFQERQKAAAAGQYQKLCYVKEFGVPGNLIRLFQDQGDLFYSKEVDQAPPCTQKFLFFNLSVITQDEQLMMAQLHLKLGLNAYNNLQKDLELIVSLVRGPNRQSDQNLLLRYLPWPQGVLHVDLLDVVNKWNSNPQSNLGLMIELLPKGNSDSTGIIRPQDNCDNWRKSIQASLMMVTLTPKECPRFPHFPHFLHFSHFAHFPHFPHFPYFHRKRRDTLPTPEPTSEHLCRRHQLVISFKELGWQQWIIAPKEFRTNYCKGDCPLSLMSFFNSSNYAFLQTLMNSRTPEIPKATCIPTKLSPLSMLYYDGDGNIILRHHKSMVVDECGCG
ncbi:growth/differentiation factor 3 [Antechinus flavipes]|uniref:growth/differentiation factor 3 n=1 Tax=Antechinus flavipes TaxID=38775 RepID=UPI002235A164|nr:growth/differentiation factor 3 [Antechinus flavipes]